MMRLSLLTALMVVTLTFIAFPTQLSATTINFNTLANGTPFTGSSGFFLSTEYAGLGVTITDSDPTAGSTYVNLTNSINPPGTAISGYYINVGAFQGVTTFVNFAFGPNVLDVAFDFATPSGMVHLFAYNALNTEIFNGFVTGSNAFFNDAGFSVLSGSGGISGVGPIARVRVEAPVDEALIVDNLRFTPSAVPEPPTLLLLGTGIVVLVGWRPRKAIGSK